jgi:adenylate kinase family enzyme
VFKNRLATYFRDTVAVTPYYAAKRRYHEVNGMASIAEVAEAIDAVLAQVK